VILYCRVVDVYLVGWRGVEERRQGGVTGRKLIVVCMKQNEATASSCFLPEYIFIILTSIHR